MMGQAGVLAVHSMLPVSSQELNMPSVEQKLSQFVYYPLCTIFYTLYTL